MSLHHIWQFEFETVDAAGGEIVARLQINGDVAELSLGCVLLAEGTIDPETAGIAWQEPHGASPEILDDVSNYFPEQLHERTVAQYRRGEL